MNYFRPKVYLQNIPVYEKSGISDHQPLLWVVQCEKKKNNNKNYSPGNDLSPFRVLEIFTLNNIHDIDFNKIGQEKLEKKVSKYWKILRSLISKVSKYKYTEYENYILVIDKYNDAVGSSIAIVIESIFALAYSYHGVLMSPDTLPNVRLLKTFDALLGTNALEHGMSQRNHLFYLVSRELCVYPELTVESINNFDTVNEVYEYLEKYRIKRSFNTILLELLSFSRELIRSFDSWNEIKCFAVYNPFDFNPNWYRTNSVGIERYAKWFDSEVLDVHVWIHFDLCGVENNTLYIRNTLSRGYFSINDKPQDFESAIEFRVNDYKDPNNPIGKKGEELKKLEEHYDSFVTVPNSSDLLFNIGIPGPPGNRWKPISYDSPGNKTSSALDDSTEPEVSKKVNLNDSNDDFEKLKKTAETVYEDLPLLEPVDDEEENEGNI